jgi:3-methylfumaryl-CoA hydratase
VHLTDWIGRTESRVDTVTAAPMAALSATLDRDDPLPQIGDPVPLLWHWLYFLPIHKQSDLAPDGHARLGDFLPPVPLPRRMYAGGSVEVRQALRVGDPVRRVSRILDVREKSGRSGPLIFVKVQREISNPAGVALIEEHDIVYRERPKRDDMRSGKALAGRSQESRELFTQAAAAGDERSAEAVALQRPASWQRQIVPDDVLLFRYSALTFNGYRIHYDRRFAIDEQGYPGLVVHAPLVATLLADLLRRHRPDADVAQFSFRALQPLFDGQPIDLHGRENDEARSVALSATDAEGRTAFEATASLRFNA